MRQVTAPSTRGSHASAATGNDFTQSDFLFYCTNEVDFTEGTSITLKGGTLVMRDERRKAKTKEREELYYIGWNIAISITLVGWIYWAPPVAHTTVPAVAPPQEPTATRWASWSTRAACLPHTGTRKTGKTLRSNLQGRANSEIAEPLGSVTDNREDSDTSDPECVKDNGSIEARVRETLFLKGRGNANYVFTGAHVRASGSKRPGGWAWTDRQWEPATPTGAS